jgi:hypothetical protein
LLIHFFVLSTLVRPDVDLTYYIMGWDWSFVLMRYRERWRRHRKIFHQSFHPTAAAAYNHIQTKQARWVLSFWMSALLTANRALLGRFHESPDDFVSLLRHLAGASILEVKMDVYSWDMGLTENFGSRSFMGSKSGPGVILTLKLPKRH